MPCACCASTAPALKLPIIGNANSLSHLPPTRPVRARAPSQRMRMTQASPGNREHLVTGGPLTASFPVPPLLLLLLPLFLLLLGGHAGQLL